MVNLKEMFFKKPVPFLTEEDTKKLLQIKKDAYLEEAEELMKKQGKEKAIKDLGIKQPKDKF